MYSSDGNGGYCDCGDSEAFLRFPLCSKHEAMKVNTASSKEVMDRFPTEVRERAREIMREVGSKANFLLYVT